MRKPPLCIFISWYLLPAKPLFIRKTKMASEKTKAIVEAAFKFVEEKRAEGWTREDFLNSLKAMLDSDTGESELKSSVQPRTTPKGS
jgi:hypothetical protein